jgi:hypothetical protein
VYGTTDVEIGLKLREHRGGQPLGEDVSDLRSRRDVEDTNVPDDNALADKVKINLNMLGALVLNVIGGEVDGAYVVAVDQSGPRLGVVQLHKQLSKPTGLCHAVGHGAVLCLSTRMRDDVLTLRGSGDEVVAQEHCVARSGMVSVGTIGPVSISVDDGV